MHDRGRIHAVLLRRVQIHTLSFFVSLSFLSISYRVASTITKHSLALEHTSKSIKPMAADTMTVYAVWCEDCTTSYVKTDSG